MKVVKSIVFVVLLLTLALLLMARTQLPDAPEVSALPSSTPTMAEPSVSPSPSPSPTPTPTPTPTPEPDYFSITAIGDCTLTSHQNLGDASPYSYASRMAGDYSYPFSNTIQYFNSDDLTIANLECTFSDQTLYSGQQFYFRAPTEYANILLQGGVDFVTTANNHFMDFGQTGADDTYTTLDNYGIPYGREGQYQIIEPPSGLVIGIYCDHNNYLPNQEKCINAIQELKNQGAEYIICAFHWGQELKYRPLQSQIDLAHACIDAGASLIYGSHSHCLQPMEEYNGGIILYSMGNWSFGGNTSPTDRDTAIFRLTVKRDLDGTITNDSYEIIPCCVSSLPVGSDNGADNDYRPCPYEPGTEEYDRAMSKILGTYDGPDGSADYSAWYQSWG